MSSISKSIASPMRTLCRRPSWRTSIGARSMPSISPTSGASAAIGPPSCPPKHLAELLGLLVRRAIVDEHAETPVPLRHDLRRVGDQRHRQPSDVRPVDLTLADVEHQRHATEVVGGAMVQGQVARTHQLAGTRLDIAALEVPRHRDPFLELKSVRRFLPVTRPQSTPQQARHSIGFGDPGNATPPSVPPAPREQRPSTRPRRRSAARRRSPTRRQAEQVPRMNRRAALPMTLAAYCHKKRTERSRGPTGWLPAARGKQPPRCRDWLRRNPAVRRRPCSRLFRRRAVDESTIELAGGGGPVETSLTGTTAPVPRVRAVVGSVVRDRHSRGLARSGEPSSADTRQWIPVQCGPLSHGESDGQHD